VKLREAFFLPLNHHPYGSCLPRRWFRLAFLDVPRIGARFPFTADTGAGAVDISLTAAVAKQVTSVLGLG